MQLTWDFTEQEIKTVRDIVAQQEEAAQRRRQRNVDVDHLPDVSVEVMWLRMWDCWLSTQQRSGPGTAIARYLTQSSFPFDWETCQAYDDLDQFRDDVFQSLTDFGGIRRTNIIANQARDTLARIQEVGWDELTDYRDKLLEQRKTEPHISHLKLENEAADFIDRYYKGFGPKQSRNYWQILGLTRYVFVLDSRIQKWVRHNLQIDDKIVNDLLWYGSLSNLSYYKLVSHLLRELCQEADVLPCVFDGAVFESMN